MRTIAMIAAEKREFAGFLRRLPRSEPLRWPLDFARQAVWRGSRYLLLANGAGPRLAAEAADEAQRGETVAALVSIGFCGGLKKGLAPGEVFVATALRRDGDSEAAPLAAPKKHPDCRMGTLYSSDRVIGSVVEKEELHRSGSDAVDMEAGGLAPKARQWDVPLHCVRAVTDTADEELVCDFNEARDASGRIRSWRVVRSALRQPSRGLPELFRLARRCRLAANNLGDFLANCEF